MEQLLRPVEGLLLQSACGLKDNQYDQSKLVHGLHALCAFTRSKDTLRYIVREPGITPYALDDGPESQDLSPKSHPSAVTHGH